MRAPNEIDFWRGLALVSIFVNHIPGFYFERFTHRNLGYSDSAELFVFLAGWSLRRLADDSAEPLGLGRLVLRLGTRAVTIYAAQILITAMAIALIAAASLRLDNPLLLEWNNAAAVFQDPIQTHVGLVLLTHQLGFFDILPLYVVLMFGSPAIAIVHRLAPVLLLPGSFALYLLTLVLAFNLPTWPVDGTWYFNPFAWQFIFVLGFALAAPVGPGALVRGGFPALRWTALPLVIAGVVLALSDWAPDPLRMPWPQLLFVVDKTFLTPFRLIHFLLLAGLFCGSFRFILRFVAHPARYLSMLGRNSLNVFCVASILSLIAQLARFRFGGGMLVDTIALMGGIGVLGLTAWVSELRERLRVKPYGPASPPSSA